MPVNFRYLEIEFPDGLAIEANAHAPGQSWRTDLAATRRGGGWLPSGRSALFRVLSVLAPSTWNELINPQRPESGKIRMVRIHNHALDPRLPR